MRQQREKFALEQKEAALRRAAELVASNRVPVEITRSSSKSTSRRRFSQQKPAATVAGDKVTKSSASSTAVTGSSNSTAAIPPQKKKHRSAIVVSTASDLHQIVTYSQNLWSKYNAIAKEHNQRVGWITVAKELGIHVKVREKYARMHSRATQRNFDFEKNGHWKIKDHPNFFFEPTQAERKAKMPPPLPPPQDDSNNATTMIAATSDNADACTSSLEKQHQTANDKQEGDEGGNSVLTGEVFEEDGTASSGDVESTVPIGDDQTMAKSPTFDATSSHHLHIEETSNTADAAAAAAVTAAAVVDAAGVGGASIGLNADAKSMSKGTNDVSSSYCGPTCV